MIYLFNRDKVAVKAIDYDDFNTLLQTEVVNGMIDLTSEIRLMKVLKGDRKPTNVKKLFDDIEFIGHFDYKEDFQMYRLIKPSVSNSTLGFYSVHIFHDEGQAKAVIHDRRWRDSQAHVVLRDAYAYIGWELTDFDSSKVLHHNAFRQTPAQVRAEVVDAYGVEIEPYLEFDGKRITRKCFRVKNKIGEETHDRFDYGSDLLDITHEEDRGDIYTAVIPRGNGEEGIANSKIEIDTIAWSKANGNPVDKPLGQNWLEVPEATQQYGYVENGAVSPRTIVMDFETDDVPELAQLAWEWINENAVPKSLMETVVHTVGRNYGLGDSIGIVYKDAGIVKKARVQKAERNLKRQILTKFQIGDYDYFIKNTVTRQYRQKLNQVEQSTNKSVEVLNDRFNTKYNEAVQRIDNSANAVKDYAEAQIIAKEQEYKENWDIRDKELNDSIEKLAGGSLDGIQTNVTELYTDMLKKLEQADLQPLESRLEASEKGIDAVFNRLEMDERETINLVYESDTRQYSNYNGFTSTETARYHLDNIESGEYFLSFDREVIQGSVEQVGTEVRIPGNYVNTEYVAGDFKRVVVRTTLNSGTREIGLRPRVYNTDAYELNQHIYSNIMLEKVAEGQTESSPYELHISEQDNDDVITRLQSQLTYNSEKLDSTFTKVTDAEKEIGTLKQTASGLETTFLNYKSDMDGEISTVKQTATNLRQEFVSMSGTVEGLESWRSEKGAVYDAAADGFRFKVWQSDIVQSKISGTNLIRNTQVLPENLSSIGTWGPANAPTINTVNGREFYRITSYDSSRSYGAIFSKGDGKYFEIVQGQDYTLSFLGYSYASQWFSYVYILLDDGTNFMIRDPKRTTVYDSVIGNLERLEFTFTAPQTASKAHVLIGTIPIEGFNSHWMRFRELKLEGGSISSTYTPSPKDSLKQTDFIVKAGSFLLGNREVGGDVFASGIVGDASGLKLLGDNIDVHGNLNVKGDVEAWSLNAVTADIGRVFADTVQAGFIKGKHVEFDSAFIKDFVGKNAFIDNAQIKAANIRDLTANSIRGGILQDTGDNFNWNLNTGRFAIKKSTLVYEEPGNAMVHGVHTQAAGIHFNRTSSGLPVVVMGTSPNVGTYANPRIDSNHVTFSGIRVFSNINEIDMTANNFRFRSEAGSGSRYDRGLYLQTYDVNASTDVVLEPFSNRSDVYKHYLGRSSNPFEGLYVSNIWGSQVRNSGSGVAFYSKNGKYGISVSDGGVFAVKDGKFTTILI